MAMATTKPTPTTAQVLLLRPKNPRLGYRESRRDDGQPQKRQTPHTTSRRPPHGVSSQQAQLSYH
uniref:Uncharacterized protein n=1 Tax=Arundo donax TaxID=35708 RepID=A0A0A9B9D3_ARUDO